MDAKVSWGSQPFLIVKLQRVDLIDDHIISKMYVDNKFIQPFLIVKQIDLIDHFSNECGFSQLGRIQKFLIVKLQWIDFHTIADLVW